MRLAIIAIVTTLALASCGEDDARVITEEGFIRLPASGSNMSAAYLSVVRGENDRLVGARIEGVDRTELHTVSEDEGIMRMRQVDGYDLSAGEPLVLKPGGKHLMLIGIDEPLDEGDEREVTLLFESGAEETMTLKVKRQPPQSGSHDH